ncbi:MAG TPA: hypothetical protein VF742_04220, partial [Terracidiphilus sp.]
MKENHQDGNPIDGLSCLKINEAVAGYQFVAYLSHQAFVAKQAHDLLEHSTWFRDGLLTIISPELSSPAMNDFIAFGVRNDV